MQHDDHIWLTIDGEGWAIRRIERGPPLVFWLWRGYWPGLQYARYEILHKDWDAYCDAAVAMLNAAAGR